MRLGLAENTGRKNWLICWAISAQLSHISTIGKKLVKQQYLLHKPSQYGELGPTNGREQLAGLGHPSKFQLGSRLRYCSDVVQRKSTKLCTMYGCLLGWYAIYTFSGAVAS